MNVTINTTSPDVTVGSSVLGTRQFSISINSISELSSSHSFIRSIPLAGLNFSYVEVLNNSNIISNYSAALENGALLNVIVSPLLFFLFFSSSHFLFLSFFLFLFFLFLFCLAFLFKSDIDVKRYTNLKSQKQNYTLQASPQYSNNTH